MSETVKNWFRKPLSMLENEYTNMILIISLFLLATNIWRNLDKRRVTNKFMGNQPNGQGSNDPHREEIVLFSSSWKPKPPWENHTKLMYVGPIYLSYHKGREGQKIQHEIVKSITWTLGKSQMGKSELKYNRKNIAGWRICSWKGNCNKAWNSYKLWENRP